MFSLINLILFCNYFDGCYKKKFGTVAKQKKRLYNIQSWFLHSPQWAGELVIGEGIIHVCKQRWAKQETSVKCEWPLSPHAALHEKLCYAGTLTWRRTLELYRDINCHQDDIFPGKQDNARPDSACATTVVL